MILARITRTMERVRKWRKERMRGGSEREGGSGRKKWAEGKERTEGEEQGRGPTDAMGVVISKRQEGG